MTIEAKVVLDSIAPNGVRLTTFELTYPRFIHAELMTHREFSRNAASSRAVPTPKKIERIRQDCAKPSEWGVNQKGMQASGPLSDVLAQQAAATWNNAKVEALRHAEMLCGDRCSWCQNAVGFDFDPVREVPLCKDCGGERLDLHKQVANRILEPFDHITVVLSTTKLKNHWKLRLETDENGRPFADPTYFELATKWKAAYDASAPKPLSVGEWHLPYITQDDWNELVGTAVTDYLPYCRNENYLQTLKAISVGRCARVSYMRQGQGDAEENVKLHDRLAKSGHWSPFEHQATPIGGFEFSAADERFECSRCFGECRGKVVNFQGSSSHVCMKCAHGHVTSGNFHGWKQYRKEFQGEGGES